MTREIPTTVTQPPSAAATKHDLEIISNGSDLSSCQFMEKINDKVTAIYAQKFKLESFCNGKVDRKKYCILDYELRCGCMLSKIVSVVGSCLTPLKHFPQQLRPETFDKNKFPSQPPSPGPQGYVRDYLSWNTCRLCCLGLLRKLGSSGSPGQLLQQQQTKIVRSLGGGGA